jgi:copper chaperone NosL
VEAIVRAFWKAGLALLLVFSACSKEEEAIPAPQAMTADATGYYCGMLLAEHGGPKGQILVRGTKTPFWFSSVRDTIAFLRLPEEPKDIGAVYVSDMAKAPSWDKPGAENWIAATDAVYVVGSTQQGGMGGAEAIPFGAKDAAAAFAAEHGGKVVGFEEARAALADVGGE